MTALESDWAFLRETLPMLRDYVLARDVYWPVRQPARSPSGPRLPQLTIGNVQLSLARLSAAVADGGTKNELEDLRRRIGQVRDEWRTNWGNKAAKEHESRLNLWQQYVRELRADPRGHAGYFASEVRQRAVLRLLLSELNGSLLQNQADVLAQLDQALRGISRPGPFVWEPEVQSGFPEGDFWFLYVTF